MGTSTMTPCPPATSATSPSRSMACSSARRTLASRKGDLLSRRLSIAAVRWLVGYSISRRPATSASAFVRSTGRSPATSTSPASSASASAAAVWVQLERQGIEPRPLGPVFRCRRRRLCRCREGVGWDGRRCAAGRWAGPLQDDLVIAQARESERPVADRLEAEGGGAAFRDRDGGQQMGGHDGLRGRGQERRQRLVEDEADLGR